MNKGDLSGANCIQNKGTAATTCVKEQTQKSQKTTFDNYVRFLPSFLNFTAGGHAHTRT